jgi:hypothetical protein
METNTPDNEKANSDNPDNPYAPASATEEPPDATTSRRLAFSKWWPLIAGVACGLALRLIFSGKPGGVLTAMTGAFIFGAPMAVGAITVYVAERSERRTWGYYLWSSALANVLFILGTLIILIEGIICAVVILPMFTLVGMAGGLIMGAVCRKTNWPANVAYGFALVPILLGAIPIDERANNYTSTVERRIVVAGTPEKIWQQLLDTRDIKANEIGHAWVYRIGVPVPEAGITERRGDRLVRKITMGKSIHFDQVSTDWAENEHVRWNYVFAEDSFPPHALDDHVTIGGHYFDILETTYSLTPRDGNTTELRVHMRYRVSTDFNWYANWIAQLLIGNFEEAALKLYAQRAAG